MESCLNYKPERVGSVTVEDLRKNLFTEFSKIPASQDPVVVEKEHLQVYLRIRPLTSSESELGESQDCISVEPPDTVVLKAPRLSMTARQSEKLGPQLAQRFQFSKVYGPETAQREIFDGTTKALVKDVLEGENSLVFTYGVTNAGKTFTFLGPESDGGILPRSLNVIFNSIVGRVYTQNNIKPHRCVDFTRLTKDQQEEEAKIKKNLLRRFKESDLQKSTFSISNSACSTLLEGSSYGELDEDSLCLEEDSHVKFSVWVSFCEIYNENIHDLLDFISNTSHRRSVLRLCQDVKGNTFVKDLTWVQVNSANEAYKVLKIGRKNQSFSSTKLNSVSSRSHSIFSIRILRIEDIGVPRVQTISELSLCDLAGSERCAKTQNRGVRLKEAGNINTSLLTLGKCMNALRLNQTQSKFQQHIPFRESKLTHYLQGFFCGRGKACMIVNINQCASMYDETINVLKFSAVAQKVVVLNPKPVLTLLPQKSARDVSMMINNVDRREWTRRSTLIGWETSLEDVQEYEDNEEMEVDDEEKEEESGEESMVENTVLEAAEDQDLGELLQKMKDLEKELSKEQSEKLAIESRIREEVTNEFMELFSNMEKDYNERLQREKEIADERAERRLEILKNLVNKNSSERASMSFPEDKTKEMRMMSLDGMIEEMQNDLANIKRDAKVAQFCLESTAHSPEAVNKPGKQVDEMAEELLKNCQLLDIRTKEMEEVQACLQNSTDQLLEANKNYENQKLKNQQLMKICQEKDEMISKLQTALDQNVEAANDERAFTIKEEILQYRNNCKCRLRDDEEKTKDQEIQRLAETLKEKNDLVAELKGEQYSLDQKLKDLTEDLRKQTDAYEAAFSLLEIEKAATAKLTNENRALNSELGDYQQAANDMKCRLKAIETKLGIKTIEADRLSDDLEKTKALLGKHEEEATKQSQMIKSLELEVENLCQKLSSQELLEEKTSRTAFQETITALQRECETVMSSSQEKSRKVTALEQEVHQIREEMCQKQVLCDQLEQERGAQREENQHLLGRYEAQTLIVEQMKRSHSELETELHGVRQQLAVLEEQQQIFTHSSERGRELEKKLGEIETHCSDLEQTLLQTENKLDQVEKREKCLKRALNDSRKEMEDLVHKNAELENKAQELLQSKKQVNEGLDTIKRLTLDMEQKEKHISDIFSQLTESSAKNGQMQKEIVTLSGEVRNLQKKLCDSEKDRDEALSVIASKEQIIEQLKTQDSANKAQLQQDHETCQELLAKERLIEEMRLTLLEEKKSKAEQERLLEAKHIEIESLNGELMKLKESCQRRCETESVPVHSHQEQKNLEKTSGFLAQTSVHESSVLSTESEKEKRFPKPELEIRFTPLNPNRLNVRRPGEEKSVMVKIKSTARKRKSVEIENSVESENRKNRRLKGNSRAKMQYVESPTVLRTKSSQLKQKGSPVSLKGMKDGTLQKIGDFIQSSPTLLGSKAKKIMAKVALKPPETENNTEMNNKPKRSKRKLFKTQISSPLDIPSHPIIGVDQDDKESDHLIIKRKLRTRTVKR